MCWTKECRDSFVGAGDKRRSLQKKPSFAASSGLPLPSLKEIRSVRLRAAGDSCRVPEAYRVFLNGTDIGVLPRLEYFDARQYLEIAPECWPLLKASNEMIIRTADEPMTIGAMVLEVETDNGWSAAPFQAIFRTPTNGTVGESAISFRLKGEKASAWSSILQNDARRRTCHTN